MNRKFPITAYTPLKYSRLECRIFNLISRKKIEFHMGVGKEAVSVCLTFDGQTFPYPGMADLPGVDLGFEARDEVWQVWFEKTRCLYDLIEQGDGSGFFTEAPPESLPREVLWAVVEAFIGDSLSRVEQILKTPVRIVAPVEPAPFDCFNVPFELVFGDKGETCTHGFFQVPLKQACVDLLETLFAGFPLKTVGAPPASGLKTGVSFQAGSVVLTPKELVAMGVGDVLIPEIWYPKDKGMVVCISPNRFVCVYDPETRGVAVKMDDGVARLLPGQGPSLVSQPLINQIDKMGKEKMIQENTAHEPPGGDGVKGVENLDLTLVFEVGRTTMTLDEIGQLTQGKVIELPQQIQEGVPVDIKVNDQLIARGKIVGIGDAVGVQITQQASVRA